MLKNLIVILFLFFINVYSFDFRAGEPVQGLSNNDSLVCSDAIDVFFKQAFKNYDDFKIEVKNLPANVTSIKFLSDQFDKNKSIISVPAEITLRGRVIKTFLSFNIRLFKQVLFANTEVKRNSLLIPANFEFRKAEVNNINGTPVYSFDEIKNAVAQRTLNAGELLILELIEKTPVIKAGDRVKANITSGSVIVSIDAVSKQDGSENEVIRIITGDKKYFKAKVIDSQNVVIIE